MSLFKELWAFMKVRKKWWLMPIILVMMTVGLLLVFAQGSALAPFIYTISCMHCMTVSLAQGGAGLGTMWGEELAQTMLENTGFVDITKHKLDHDFLNVYWVMRR